MSIERSHFGASGVLAFCCFCGDYETVKERLDALILETQGCDRCRHDGPRAGTARQRGDMKFDGIIYDVEIERAIPPKSGDLLIGIEYCDGWRDFAGMGISVIGVYDYQRDAAFHLLKDQLSEFQSLVDDRRWVIGFNSLKFDNNLVRAHGVTVPEEKTYDILQSLWAADGLGPEFNPRTHGGYGLDRVCAVNFGMNKTGSGELAPVMWQQGRREEVIAYCMNDTLLTRQIMDRILRDQPIRNPKRSYQTLTLPNPLRFSAKEQRDEQSGTGGSAATK